METIINKVAHAAGWLWRNWLRPIWVRRRDLSAAPFDGKQFSILLARLDHDDEDSQRRHIRDALMDQDGFQVHMRETVLSIDGPDPNESRRRAEERGRELLDSANADLLIWGEVAEQNKSLRLRFLPASEKVSTGKGTYTLSDSEMPKNFSENLNSQLMAIALASVAPATDQQGQYLVQLLRPQIKKLKRLADNSPADLSADQRGRLWEALAIALATVGEQTGNTQFLEEAITTYQAALKERTRERVPLDWATTQNNLGSALFSLGERESGTERLEASVAAYRAALEERTRERVPLQWAATQNNLGNALFSLGKRERGTERLEASVAAYRAALEEYTRERVPLQWAATQNNLGNALSSLGERERGTERLEASVTAYRAALEERTRERVPLQWAATQNNLGNALSSIGERERGTERLEASVAAYRAALEERTRERVPLDWATTQNNLGNALRTLGQRENNLAQLESALAAYEAALAVFEGASADYYVEIVQRSIEHTKTLITNLSKTTP